MTFASSIVARLRGRGLLLVVLLAVPTVGLTQATVYYRYIDSEGVQVLDDSIPPEYVRKGYEVVSLSGEVIKTVEPAPDAETLARREAETRLREAYLRLDRRYSSLADIESARDRKLKNIETNIALVRSDIAGLEKQIRTLMSQAADLERQGRDVPKTLVRKLEATREELASAEERLEMRLREKKATAERFAQDMEDYVKGRELLEAARSNR